MAVSLATLMMLVDFAAVSVALPSVHGDVQISFSGTQWVLEAFVVTLAAFILTAGYVADRKGLRPAFLAGLVIFGVGSIVAGAAPVTAVLIGGRVVQGVGGALIFATGSALLAETFRRKVNRAALVVWGTVTGLGVAVSPLLGGLVAGYLGWRFVFLLDVPVTAVALFFAVGATFHEPVRQASPGRPDIRAVFLFTGAIALFVIGLVGTSNSSSLIGTWSDNGVIALFVCSALLLIALVAVEAVSPAPLLDISLFGSRTFSGSAVAALGLSLAVWGPFLYLVLYMSYDLGYSVEGIGLRLLLLTGMTLPFLPVANYLDQVLPIKFLICGGLVMVAGGLFWMSHVSVGTGWDGLMPGLVMAGVGLELVNPRLATAAAATVKPQLAAVASRTSSTLRLVGTAGGVAIFGSLFATRLKDMISADFLNVPQLTGYAPRVTELALEGRLKAAQLIVPASVQVDVPAVVHQGFTGALHSVLLAGAVVALASAILALALRSSDVPRPMATSEPELQKAKPATRTVREASTVADQPDEGLLAGPTAAAPVELPVPAPGEDSPPEQPDDPAPTRALSELLSSFLAAVQQPEEPSPATSEVAGPAPVTTGLTPPSLPEDDERPGWTGSGFAPVGEQAPGSEPAPGAPESNLEPEPEVVGAGTAHGHVIDLTRGQRCVTGQVTAMTGEPLAGAMVTLVGPDGGEAAHAVAEGDGSFALEDVGEGTYTVVAAAPNFRPAASMVALRSGGASTTLTLLGIGSLAGRVMRARDGAPLPAELELTSTGGGLAARGHSDHDGAFIIADLIEGEYELLATVPGYRPERVRLTVERGRSRTVDVALTGLGHLYGAVCGPGGGWVADVEVALADIAGRVVSVTTTDGAGSYQFPGVVEGLYTLVTPSGNATGPVSVGPGATVAADLALEYRRP